MATKRYVYALSLEPVDIALGGKSLRILRGWFLYCVIQVDPRGHYMYPYKRDMEEDLVQTRRGEGMEAEAEVMWPQAGTGRGREWVSILLWGEHAMLPLGIAG